MKFLTKDQKIILDKFKADEYLRSTFYFTGGTALSSVYLHHRESEDLDFFSQTKFDRKFVTEIVELWAKDLKATVNVRAIEHIHINTYYLTFSNNSTLKLDFNYYAFDRLKKGKIVDSIEVDSITDIAANKLLTVNQRTEVKDFVDLYFLLKKYSIWDLSHWVRMKFNVEIEPWVLAMDLLKVEGFENLPKMIKKLRLEDLKDFYYKLAKKLSGTTTE